MSYLFVKNGDTKKIVWGIITIGFFLRVSQYLFNRSLWIDETWLVLNILERSWEELFYPLDYHQGAPLGFLLIQKFLVTILGENEYILRLFPLICGILSLFLFYKITEILYNNSQSIKILATGLFAISDRLIYYSSEAKQYSSDVLVSIFILYMALNCSRLKYFSVSNIILSGLFGSLLIWYAHPAIFILSGAGIYLTLSWAGKKKWRAILHFSPVLFLWTLSFILYYLFSLYHLSRQTYLLNFWHAEFMPFPPLSHADVLWFGRTFLDLSAFITGLSITAITGLSPQQLTTLPLSELIKLSIFTRTGIFYSVAMTGLTGFVLIAGWIIVLLKDRSRWILLGSPVLFVLLASGIRKYPFHGRLLLFLFPFLILLIAEGAMWLALKVRCFFRGAGALFIVLVCLHPIASAGYYLVNPRTVEEIRQGIAYVGKHRMEGERIYVNSEAGYALRYYGARFGIQTGDYIVGRVSPDDIITLCDNQRIWLLFSQVRIHGSQMTSFLNELHNRGEKIDAFMTSTGEGRTFGVVGYLYDFRSEPEHIQRDNELCSPIPSLFY